MPSLKGECWTEAAAAWGLLYPHTCQTGALVQAGPEVPAPSPLHQPSEPQCWEHHGKTTISSHGGERAGQKDIESPTGEGWAGKQQRSLLVHRRGLNVLMVKGGFFQVRVWALPRSPPLKGI